MNIVFKLADANNIKVIYLTIPINQASDNILMQKFRDDYSNYFTSLKKEFPKVLFYSEIKPFENKYFGDESHFNNNGIIEFSKEINKILNNESVTDNSLYE